MIEIAQQIDHVPFNLLRDRHIFCSAPVKHDNKIIIDNFVIMAEDFVKYNKGIHYYYYYYYYHSYYYYDYHSYYYYDYHFYYYYDCHSYYYY